MKRIRLGTRGSKLALWQAQYIERRLRENGYDVELVHIATTGDVRQSGPIVRLGAQGVFTKEIERKLLDGEIDMAVHSLKDLPTEPVPGLHFAASPARGPVEDAFVSNRYSSLDELPDNALVGTGSLRRQTQLLYACGHRIRVEDIRGNVETRLAKLDCGDYDALVLAVAGLERLELGERIRIRLSAPQFLPAVGQGALALETRTSDPLANEAADSLNDRAAYLAVLAERALLLTLQGGCIAPIAAHALLKENRLFLYGRILSLDARVMYEAHDEIDLSVVPDDKNAFKTSDQLAQEYKKTEYKKAESLGRCVADSLLRQGADRIVASVLELRSRSSS